MRHGKSRNGRCQRVIFPFPHPLQYPSQEQKCDRKDDYTVGCPDLIESILLLVFWKGSEAGRNGTEILYGINRSGNVSALQRR